MPDIIPTPAAPPADSGQDLVIQADSEWITKESRVQTLEQLAIAMRDQWVRATLDLGRILYEHSCLCNDGDRISVLFDRLGLSRTGGYRLIRVAQTVALMPKLADLAERQFSHVVTLIEAADTETLSQIVGGELHDLSLDDVDHLSVRQLRERVRQLTSNHQKFESEEVKTLKSENQALTDDLSAARAALDPDLKAARKSARQLRDAVQTLADAADRLMDQLGPLEQHDLTAFRDAINTTLQSGTIRLKECWGRWQEMQAEYGIAD